MRKYCAGLDVSGTTTSICVVDQSGDTVAETTTPTDPAAIAKALRPHQRHLRIAAQETGGLAVWLHRELVRKGLPMACLDARITRAALRAQRNKTDRNDARDIAILLSRGFSANVHVKSDGAHCIRLLLTCRRTMKRKAHDLQMTLTKTMKLFGVTLDDVCTAKSRQRWVAPFARETVEGMVRARDCLLAEVEACDRAVKAITTQDPVCQRLMTAPGVGPLTALTFKAAVDDPTRFAKSRLVGAYFGLTPRRIQSGQSDFAGRVSKLGDRSVRTALYEAAIVMLVHSRTQSRLRAWGLKLVEKRGYKFAAVACARKLAVILHRLWVTGESFQPQQVKV